MPFLQILRPKRKVVTWDISPRYDGKAFENFVFMVKKGTWISTYTIWIPYYRNQNQEGENTAYKIGQVIRKVLPSDETIQTLYGRASSYAAGAQESNDYRA